MSTTITSYALASSVQWPNLTMPHFEIRGENNNRLSKALQVTFAPLVKNKQEWEQYAKENQEWIKEGLVHAGAPEEDITNVRGIADFVWRLDQSSQGSAVVQSTNGVDFGPGSFAPVWQQSPAPHDTSIINFDLLSHPTFQRVYHGMWETAKPVLSEVTDLAFLYEGAVHEEEDGTNPHSFLLSPVYDSFEGTRTRDNIIGFLVAVLPWDSYFSNLLPNSVKGMDVVLHNTCGNHFTYRINGPNAVFVGEGDLHEKAYDYLEVDTPFSPFLEHEFSENNEHCEYDLRIFPSAKLHAEYTTTKPAIYTIVVIAVFFFTAMVFALYDHFVNVRQKKVMATAKRTNAIVSSLFPQNVRERILKDAEEQAAEDMKGKTIFGFNAPAKTQLKNFLDVEDGTANPHGSKPIADLFPDATVMVRQRSARINSESICASANSHPFSSPIVCGCRRFYRLELGS